MSKKQFTIDNTVLSVKQNLFQVLYAQILIYLLGIDYIIRYLEPTPNKKLGKEEKKEIYAFEPASNFLKDRIAIWKDNPAGSISFLKKDDLTYSLAIWRDQFIKDMYISTIRDYRRVKMNHTEKFIYHKFEELKGKWSITDLEESKESVFDLILSKKRLLFSNNWKNLWDWRLAYQRENPYESMDPAVMDRVERDYPNYGDKIRIKPENRTRQFADSKVKDCPNYKTEDEYNDPELWEGVVIGVRNPEDMIIKIRMIRIFWGNPEKDDYSFEQACLDFPIDYVEGLGAASQKDLFQAECYFYILDPYHTIYGMPVKTIPDHK